MEDWITALIGFLGVILGTGIQEYRQWRERKEEYQRMVFLKRLDAHQKAFEWCHILNRELNGGNPDKIEPRYTMSPISLGNGWMLIVFTLIQNPRM